MKFGIITLHKVLNFGSALQAYALQYYIQKNINQNTELIDYIYPNAYHTHFFELNRWGRTKSFFRRLLKENLLEKRYETKSAFKRFYNDFYVLSNDVYTSINQIESASPEYDLYITGSDQVWNVNTVFNDPVFFCSFAPVGSPRISFGASFSINKLPDIYKQSVKERLQKYSYIGVREQSGVDIVNSLNIDSDIKVLNTCDPTLLLNRNDYKMIIDHSSIFIDGDYILVYKLEYAYKVQPSFAMAVEKARKYFGCKVVVIGDIKTRLKREDKRILGIGPCEFLWLFQNAKAVVTSSFHGTIFSLVFRKKFVSIVPPLTHPDKRIYDLLIKLDLEANCIINEKDNKSILIEWRDYDTAEFEKLFGNYINESKSFLKKACQIV